jgi:hypothetical protein
VQLLVIKNYFLNIFDFLPTNKRVTYVSFLDWYLFSAAIDVQDKAAIF